MYNLSNDHQDHSNLHKNSHRLCDELGRPILSLKKSQWKLRQRTWSEFPYGVKAIAEEILASEERNNPKEQDCECHGQGSK